MRHQREFSPDQAERARLIKVLQNKGAKLSQLARADLADLAGKAFVVFDGSELRACRDAAAAIATVVRARRPCSAVDLAAIRNDRSFRRRRSRQKRRAVTPMRIPKNRLSGRATHFQSPRPYLS